MKTLWAVFISAMMFASGSAWSGDTAYLVDTYRGNGQKVCIYETSQGEVYELVKDGEAGSCPRTHYFD